jgi:single-strand DNA-binding protein
LGNLAEICKQYLNKGQQVYVEGRLQTRRWEDSDSYKRTSVEIVASEMMILGDRHDSSQSNDDSQDPETGNNEEEYPF